MGGIESPQGSRVASATSAEREFLLTSELLTPERLISDSVSLLLELRRLLLLRLSLRFAFFKPLAELFIDGRADLDQAPLHPIQVLMKSDAEDFVHGHETQIGEKFAGKALRFHSVLKISSIDSR